jgi:hypothetical protein
VCADYAGPAASLAHHLARAREYWAVPDTLNGVGFVRLLGPVQVVLSSGRIVELPSASQRRLLAVLALHVRASIRAEWLADTLGVSPGALRTTVSRLRKLLGDTELQTTTTGYRLDVDVDAEMFCREIADAPVGIEGVGVLEAALARWVGPALEEFANEGWAAGEVARLTELRASATEDLAAALIATSRLPGTIALLEAHVIAYPLRDRPRGLLMEALAADRPRHCGCSRTTGSYWRTSSAPSRRSRRAQSSSGSRRTGRPRRCTFHSLRRSRPSSV